MSIFPKSKISIKIEAQFHKIPQKDIGPDRSENAKQFKTSCDFSDSDPDFNIQQFLVMNSQLAINIDNPKPRKPTIITLKPEIQKCKIKDQGEEKQITIIVNKITKPTKRRASAFTTWKETDLLS